MSFFNALLFATLVLQALPAAASSNVYEIDLISPRNGTWSPTGPMPIVFAVQRPDLSQPLAVELIFWTLLQHDSQSSESRTGGAIEAPRFNASVTSPYFLNGIIGSINGIEDTWTLSWHFSYGSCKSFPAASPDAPKHLDTSLFTFASLEQSIDFTTNKTAPKLDVDVSYGSETCCTSSNMALNVTGVLDVHTSDFRGHHSCAVLGATPTQSNPCAVKIDSAAASSVSAAVALEACRASATGYLPCASLITKSAGHVAGMSTARVAVVCIGVMICMLF